MAFFGIPYAATDQLRRLNEATASNIAAQEGLQQAGEESARSSRKTRHGAVMERRKAQLAARALKANPLHTSEVREAVEEMLMDMDRSADHRAQRRQ